MYVYVAKGLIVVEKIGKNQEKIFFIAGLYMHYTNPIMAYIHIMAELFVLVLLVLILLTYYFYFLQELVYSDYVKFQGHENILNTDKKLNSVNQCITIIIEHLKIKNGNQFLIFLFLDFL